MSKNPFPTRMCSGCMARRAKSELVRIVRQSDGKAIVDEHHSLPGRGAYVCRNEECIRKAQKRNWFSRSLKGEVDKIIYEELSELLKKG